MHVVAELVGSSLALELAVVLQAFGIEIARRGRRFHRAARLGVVAAVVKATAADECRDVAEHGVEAILVEELQLAHAWGVEQQAAAGHADELTMGRDVAATAIACADRTGGHAVFTEQGVDQRRLAGP